MKSIILGALLYSTIAFGGVETGDSCAAKLGFGSFEPSVSQISTITRNRGLSQYLFVMGDLLQTQLDRVSSHPHMRWIDAGSGHGIALLDFGQLLANSNSEFHPQLTALSYKTDLEDSTAIQVIQGQLLEDMTPAQIGVCNLWTDVMGPFSQTQRPDLALQNTVVGLGPDDVALVFLGTFREHILVSIRRKDGSIVSLEEWIKAIPGLNVEFHRLPISNTLAEDIRGGGMQYSDTLKISPRYNEVIVIPALSPQPLIKIAPTASAPLPSLLLSEVMPADGMATIIEKAKASLQQIPRGVIEPRQHSRFFSTPLPDSLKRYFEHARTLRTWLNIDSNGTRTLRRVDANFKVESDVANFLRRSKDELPDLITIDDVWMGRDLQLDVTLEKYLSMVRKYGVLVVRLDPIGASIFENSRVIWGGGSALDMMGKSRANMDQSYNLPYYFRMGGTDKSGFRISYSFKDKTLFIERQDERADNFHMRGLEIIGFENPQDITKGILYQWKPM